MTLVRCPTCQIEHALLDLSHECPSYVEFVTRALNAEAEVERLRALVNTPELTDFVEGVKREAVHQRERWGSAHDAGKEPADWIWLLGHLAGKALHAQTAGNVDKALHHTISSAAVLANWHAAILGKTDMRPGIVPPDAPHIPT